MTTKFLKNKLTLSLIVGLSFCLNSFGQTDSFFKVFDFPNLFSSCAYQALQTEDDGYIVGGNIIFDDFGVYNTDLSLMKLDAHGDIVWTKTYGDNLRDWAEDICITDDNHYVVVGTKDHYVDLIDGTPSQGKLWVLKVDSAGDLIWSKTYGDSFNNYAKSIAKTNDGGYIVCGVKENIYVNSYGTPWILKLDEYGDTIWTRTLYFSDNPSTGENKANSIIETSDNSYIVAGSALIPDLGGVHMFFTKLNQEGDTIWTRLFGGYLGHDVVETNDSCYIVVGRSECEDIQVKIDKSGNIVWNKSIAFPNDYCPDTKAICLTMDNNFITSGTRGYPSDVMESKNLWIKLCNEHGDTINTKALNHSFEFVYSINPTSDNGFIIAGRYSDHSAIIKLNLDIFTSINTQPKLSENELITVLNPIKDNLIINFHDDLNIQSQNLEIELYTYVGNLVLKTQAKAHIANQQTINISKLTPGFYILKITNNKDIFVSKSVIIL